MTADTPSSILASRFAAVPCACFRDNENTLCFRLEDGVVHKLSPVEAHTLLKLRGFETQDRHALSLCLDDIKDAIDKITSSRLMPRQFGNSLKSWVTAALPAQSESLSFSSSRKLKILHQLATKGLLVSEADLLIEGADRPSSSTNPRQIAFLGIPTAGRSGSLRICLTSFIVNALSVARENLSIIVVDDSINSVEEANNCFVIETLQKQVRHPIRHIGKLKRTKLVQAISIKGNIPSDVVGFAINPPVTNIKLSTVGAARNLLHLFTLGEYALFADDDTRCSYAAADAVSQKLSISAKPAEYETRFFDTHTSCMAKHLPIQSFSPLIAHESYLGKTLSELISSRNGVQINDIDQQLSDSIRNRSARIGITSTGCLGDSGMWTSSGLILSPTSSFLKAMEDDPKIYRRMLSNRIISRLTENPIASRAPTLQTMSYALDNTILQPPLFPIGRNTDGAFAHLHSRVCSSAMIAHLPWGIEHCPISPREYLIDPTVAHTKLRLTDIIILLVGTIKIPSMISRSTALQLIGIQLEHYGQLSVKSFESLVWCEYMKLQDMIVANIDLQISSFRGCLQRKQDLELMRLRSKTAVADSHALVLIEFTEYMKPQACFEFILNCVRMYGRLLCHWEMICETMSRICY